MVDIGPVLTAPPGWVAPEGVDYELSVGQLWQWKRAGLLDEDIVWLVKMLAPAHEGHPRPDPCWIMNEYLKRPGRRKIRSW